ISVTNIAMEQYRDFVMNRAFRHSIVCHSDVQLERTVDPSVAFDLWYGMADRVRAGSDDLTSLHGADGRTVTITAEPALRVLRFLSERYPQATHFNQLFDEAGGESDRESFGQLL